MQKTGAGLVSAASTYWDIKKDGLCKVSWENATMLCVATAYGTSVNIDYPEVVGGRMEVASVAVR